MNTAPLEAHLSDPVTHHMRSDFARLNVGQSVGEALTTLRRHPPTGRIIYLYVIDDDGRLRGVVPTRRLLLNPPETSLADIMVREVIAIPESATVLEACEFFTLHRLLAFPVIDGDGRIVGVVDIDLYTGELSDLDRQRGGADLFQLVGVHLTEADQRHPGVVVRRRFPWLLCNVAAGMLAALLADAYRDVATLILVTPFIPVVLALAESVSIQSVSLALQTLHGRRPSWNLLAKRLGREIVVGLLLGAGCGLSVGLIALAWKGSARLGLSLFLGIGGGVAAAAAVGLAMPNMLKLLRRDPQVASGPIALAVADMITLLLYFNLGRWLML